MKHALSIIVIFLMGGLVGFFLNHLLGSDITASSDSDEEKPLYWVAPMDPNYRRDGPGKSPMGMDLVPVYESDRSSDDEAGSVRINPAVINNLGVRTASVKERSLTSEIETVGYVKYDEDNLFHIHPRVEGWIETLYVKAEGDPVTKGQPIYKIYSPELVNAQEELLVAIQRNNSSLIAAAKARLKALQLSEAHIKSLLDTRRVAQHITFYAPSAGVVDSLNIREGFFVKPGTKIMSIGELSTVWVEAEVFERQAAYINQGDTVSMTTGFLPNRQWIGQVDYVYPTLNAKTRTVKLRLRFKNDDRALKPNMFAQVAIQSTIDDPVLTVPREAVIRTGRQDRVVLAQGDGLFKSVEVALGRSSGEFFEVLSGLTEGETIVTSAQFLIDSESSKTSDFKRMDSESTSADDILSATVDGVINAINKSDGVVNISRGPIEKWNRGPMTMDFLIENIDLLEDISVNDKVRFTFEIREGEFIIVSSFKPLPDESEHQSMKHDESAGQNASGAHL